MDFPASPKAGLNGINEMENEKIGKIVEETDFEQILMKKIFQKKNLQRRDQRILKKNILRIFFPSKIYLKWWKIEFEQLSKKFF